MVTICHDPRCSKSRAALRRPLVANGERAALGRPPEAVLDVL